LHIPGVLNVRADGLSRKFERFPSLLGRVLNLLLEQQAVVTLVVPRWTAAWWWPEVSRAACDCIRIPAQTDLFQPGQASPAAQLYHGVPKFD
jgi:hypothetical protein